MCPMEKSSDNKDSIGHRASGDSFDLYTEASSLALLNLMSLEDEEDDDKDFEESWSLSSSEILAVLEE